MRSSLRTLTVGSHHVSQHISIWFLIHPVQYWLQATADLGQKRYVHVFFLFLYLAVGGNEKRNLFRFLLDIFSLFVPFPRRSLGSFVSTSVSSFECSINIACDASWSGARCRVATQSTAAQHQQASWKSNCHKSNCLAWRWKIKTTARCYKLQHKWAERQVYLQKWLAVTSSLCPVRGVWTTIVVSFSNCFLSPSIDEKKLSKLPSCQDAQEILSPLFLLSFFSWSHHISHTSLFLFSSLLFFFPQSAMVTSNVLRMLIFNPPSWKLWEQTFQRILLHALLTHVRH